MGYILDIDYSGRMLHEFLTLNRAELIEKCRDKVALRSPPESTSPQVAHHGIPFFLDQLIKTLEVEQTARPMDSRKVSGIAGATNPSLSELGDTATRHGGELMRLGYTIEQVVHDYGDLCQSITDLAFERKEAIGVDEFRTLNRCLDNGIAMAVTEFSYQRDFVVADKYAKETNIQIGFLVHELRNFLNTAALAIFAIRDGNLGHHGATATVLDRALDGMRSLVDRSLSDVRLTAGLPLRNELFRLADFIEEVKLSADLSAKAKNCKFTVSVVDPLLALDADRDLLLSAVVNLLQNAFKFTHPETEVILNTYSLGDRVFIDVEDHGDGLAEGQAEKMFEPFTQSGTDRQGLGLGLSICLRSVEANQGILSVRNKPDSGCIFTVNLPRHSMPAVLA